MAFDWKTIAPLVAGIAPVAGSILGGLVGGPLGSTIGGKLGSVIAQQFGLPATASPGQVSDAIAEAGEETARAKINAAMEIARAQIDGFVEVEKATEDALAQTALGTQETMRAEITSQEPFFYRGWRPTAGWLYDAMMVLFGALLAWATLKTVLASPNPLDALYAAWPLYAAYLGCLAIVNGILIPSRSLEKAAAMSNGVPMPNAVSEPTTKMTAAPARTVIPAVRPTRLQFPPDKFVLPGRQE